MLHVHQFKKGDKCFVHALRSESRIFFRQRWYCCREYYHTSCCTQVLSTLLSPWRCFRGI